MLPLQARTDGANLATMGKQVLNATYLQATCITQAAIKAAAEDLRSRASVLMFRSLRAEDPQCTNALRCHDPAKRQQAWQECPTEIGNVEEEPP